MDEKYGGMEEIDGLEILTLSLGSQFPEDIFIVQDGDNHEDKKLVNQNFAFVDLRNIFKMLDLGRWPCSSFNLKFPPFDQEPFPMN